jgi:hypothetical protein
MSYRARLKLSTAAHGLGDVLPGDFVRLIGGSTLGLVESINGDHATVADLRKPGHREILPVSLLTRAVRPV